MSNSGEIADVATALDQKSKSKTAAKYGENKHTQRFNGNFFR